MTNESPLVLVIDDVAQNLQVLNASLAEHGYRVAAAKSGEQAFKALERIQPDLILLDIMMPDMDGYEVCERLKSNRRTKNIPVIFLTAKSESTDLIKGFESGGVDYIIKPFQTPELIARVKTHTELKRNRDLILEYSLQIKDRATELERLNDEKNQFLGIASHDLKNPLGNILTLSQLMKSMPDPDPKQLDEFMAIIERSAKKMLSIIENLLDVNRIESGELKVKKDTIELREALTQVKDSFLKAAEKKAITVHFSVPESPVECRTDPMLLSQILDNLVSNAIKYSPKEKQVWITLEQTAEAALIHIKDEGPGFSEMDQAKLYQKFARLTAQPTGGESSTGLGLSIVKKLVEAVDGDIALESEVNQGSTFILTLPLS